jgi:hypothetical protein
MSVNRGLQLNDPQTLYRHWEESQWSPFAVELSADGEQWPALTEAQRGLILLGISDEEVRAFALSGLTRRLDVIGVPLSSL